MNRTKSIEIFLVSKQQIGIRTKTNNLFLIEIIKQVPFSSFDYKKKIWKVPIWTLPELIEKLKIRESSLPDNVLAAYKQVLEIERKTAVVYLNMESGIISAIARKDAYRNVKRFLQRYCDRKHAIISPYGKFLEAAEKYKVIVRASKDVKDALDPKKFATRFVSKVKTFFPSFPDTIPATVVDVSYVKQTAVCDICKSKKTRFFLIRNNETGTVVRACMLCAAIILDPKIFKKYKAKLDKVILKNNMKRAKEHKGFFFNLFRAKPILKNRFPRRQRDLNKIRAEVSNILQDYERKVAESSSNAVPPELPEIEKEKAPKPSSKPNKAASHDEELDAILNSEEDTKNVEDETKDNSEK